MFARILAVTQLVNTCMIVVATNSTPKLGYLCCVSCGHGPFLGQNVRKYRGKLLIKPAAKNISALLDKIRTIVKRNKASTQAELIHQLNPVIRDWANYHRHIVAKATFTKVDS